MTAQLENTERYERWLNEAASTFEDPQWAKSMISDFMRDLRDRESDRQIVPTDSRYSREYIAAVMASNPVPATFNRIKVEK